MTLYLKLLIVIQMLLVNLYVTIKCSRLRKSIGKTRIILATFTVFFLAFLFIILPELPEDTAYKGDGLYLLFSVVYFLPLIYLTDQPWQYTITIMAAPWVYTMFVYVISHRIAYNVNPDSLQLYSLVLQSILFMATFKLFSILIEDKFIFTIWNSDINSLYFIMSLGISALSLLFIHNYTYIHGSALFNEILEPAILVIILILGLNFANSFVKANKSVETIEKRSRKDPLTRLGNREAMLEDAHKRVLMGEPFCLLFVDLDDFKSVNDIHGHGVGDDYLVAFSNTVRKYLMGNDKFYRIAGDEFVLLSNMSRCDELVERLNTLQFINNPRGVEFRGLSTGHVYFPEEENNIVSMLSKADERMYQEKKHKHRKLID